MCADTTKAITEQAHTTLDKVNEHLVRSCSPRKHFLSATIYLKTMDDLIAMNKVWDNWVPARACVIADTTREELFTEISVVAAEKQPKEILGN